MSEEELKRALASLKVAQDAKKLQKPLTERAMQQPLPEQIYGPPSSASMSYGPPASTKFTPGGYKPVQKPAKKVSPYSAQKAATPIPDPTLDLGLTQPNTMEPEPLDLFSMQPLRMRDELNSMPKTRGLGAQDMYTSKYGRDYDRQAQRKIYQTGDEYAQNVQNVLDLPILQKLAEGANQYGDIRKQFMENMPLATDLSPVAAFADYLAKGKGTALAGYKPPMTYQQQLEMNNLLAGNELDANQALAAMALNQAGGLAKGTEQASLSTDEDLGRVMGTKPVSGSVARAGQDFQKEKWIIDNNMKMAKDYEEQSGSLEALERALEVGDLQSIQRALSLAARTLSRETGVMTEQDVARVLPATKGFDIAKFRAYISDNPQVLVDPYVIKGLKEETKYAKDAMRQRFANKQNAFAEQLQQSSAMGGMSSLEGLMKPNKELFKAPPPPPEKPSEVRAMMKDILMEMRNGRKK